MEINPKRVGVLYTDKDGTRLRVFCYYTNGEIFQFEAPLDENNLRLRDLFAALKVDENCTSVMLDEAVQGRIHVRADNQHWIYTLLHSPGNVSLPLNADVSSLPWQTVWRSQGEEVIEYLPPGGVKPCYAIRSRMNEADADRAMQNSMSFAHPVTPPRRQPHRWLYLYMGLALLAVAVVAAGTLYYTFKTRRAAPASARTLAGRKTGPTTALATSYLLLYNHRISGPYPTSIVTNMNAEGLLSGEALCRPEDSLEWERLAAVFPTANPKLK